MDSKFLTVVKDAIDKYSRRDIHDLLTAEIKYLKEYVNQKEVVLARTITRQSLYVYLRRKMEGDADKDKEVFNEDIEMIGIFMESLNKEIGYIKNKIKMLERFLRITAVNRV